MTINVLSSNSTGKIDLPKWQVFSLSESVITFAK